MKAIIDTVKSKQTQNVIVVSSFVNSSNFVSFAEKQEFISRRTTRHYVYDFKLYVDNKMKYVPLYIFIYLYDY